MTPRVSAEQDRVVEWLCAIAEPAQLAVLRVLARGPKSVGELSAECGVGQTNVSHHAAVLKQHGISPSSERAPPDDAGSPGARVREKMLELAHASGSKVTVPLD
jgi:DNA-binding transcriptional ArsR family regulator